MISPSRLKELAYWVEGDRPAGVTNAELKELMEAWKTLGTIRKHVQDDAQRRGEHWEKVRTDLASAELHAAVNLGMGILCWVESVLGPEPKRTNDSSTPQLKESTTCETPSTRKPRG